MKYIFLVSLLFVQWVHGQQVIQGDFADPSIIKVKTSYYAVGTSSEWAPHFPIYFTSDLQNWEAVGHVFDEAPAWTSGSFWAPEYYYYNNTYYIYYTARRKADGISCIGVATSQYPDKDFKDHGVIVDFGKEAIDAFVYNDNGQLYMTFKAYGLDKRPIEILGSKLSKDGLKLEGEVFSLLKDSDKQGMEGQSILKNGKYYYLFYSAGACCGAGCSYNVRVARAASFKGPYENYTQNPILSENEKWKCMGHGSFVKQNDGKYLYMHHGYNKESTVWTGREGLLADLTWKKDGWPSLTSQQTNAQFSDDADTWQWDFRNTTPVVRDENGKLHLSGTVKEGNVTGVVLALRPVAENFELTVMVENNNAALKGLAVYGDASEAIGVGVVNDTVEFWMVTGNKRTTLATAKINAGKPVQLKFSMNKGEASYSQAGTGWTQLTPAQKPVMDRLPQWDRSPRAGMHFKGAPNEEAVFSGFTMRNSRDN